MGYDLFQCSDAGSTAIDPISCGEDTFSSGAVKFQSNGDITVALAGAAPNVLYAVHFASASTPSTPMFQAQFLV
jgi:hypothetical protein